MYVRLCKRRKARKSKGLYLQFYINGHLHLNTLYTCVLWARFEILSTVMTRAPQSGPVCVCVLLQHRGDVCCGSGNILVSWYGFSKPK
jgi:hypothetical protein